MIKLTSLSLLVAVTVWPGVLLAAQPIWIDHNDSDPAVAAPHAPGEKGGTEDLNIGIGELKEGNSQTDLAWLRERASVARGLTRD